MLALPRTDLYEAITGGPVALCCLLSLGLGRHMHVERGAGWIFLNWLGWADRKSLVVDSVVVHNVIW